MALAVLLAHRNKTASIVRKSQNITIICFEQFNAMTFGGAAAFFPF